jgi:hypothetical protein
MPDYAESKIYMIRSFKTDKIYIGSTTKTLKTRLCGHVNAYNIWLKTNTHYVSSIEILKFDDYYIELIKLCPCNSKKELLKMEGEEIKLHPNCVNLLIAGRTNKEYCDEFRDVRNEHKREYVNLNREAINKKKREFYEKNKIKINEKRKELYDSENSKAYYEIHKDKINKKTIEYYKQHKEELKKKRKEYIIKNKEKIQEQRRQEGIRYALKKKQLKLNIEQSNIESCIIE